MSTHPEPRPRQREPPQHVLTVFLVVQVTILIPGDAQASLEDCSHTSEADILGVVMVDSRCAQGNVKALAIEAWPLEIL